MRNFCRLFPALAGVSFFSIAFAQQLPDLHPAASVYADADRADVRVELTALQAAAKNPTVDVSIYLRGELRERDVLGHTVDELKAPFRARIDEMSARIRSVYARYPVVGPLTDEARHQRLFAPAEQMSPSERQELFELKERIAVEENQMRLAVRDAYERIGAHERAEIRAEIIKHGGSVHADLIYSNAISATLPSPLLVPLSKHRLVEHIALRAKLRTWLDVSVPAVGFGDWWDAGVTGGGSGGNVWIGVIDNGIDETHPAFSHLAFHKLSSAWLDSDHGTHVTGIVASADDDYKGGAYNARGVLWGNFESNTGSNIELSAMTNLFGLGGESPDVVNASYGSDEASTADRDSSEIAYDNISVANGVLISFAAGNDGWTQLYPLGRAYNPLTVAAMDDNDTETLGDDFRYSGSQIGPTPSGRRKPDITAPGQDIESAVTPWTHPVFGDLYHLDFGEKTGTSMAAPHVTAAIALLEDDGANVTANRQKALLINSARPWTSNETSFSLDDHQKTTGWCVALNNCPTLWDVSYGWGYMDLARAFESRLYTVEDTLQLANDNGADDDFHYYVSQGVAQYWKATAVWSIRNGESTPANLDLFLYDPFLDLPLDSDTTLRDNVQQVVSPRGTHAAPELVVVKVKNLSTTGNPIEYALAGMRSVTRVNAPVFSTTYTGVPALIGKNSGSFELPVTTMNDGDLPAHEPRIRLGNIPGLINDNRTLAFAAPLGAGQSGTRTFSNLYVNEFLATGEYQLEIFVEDDSYGEYHESTAQATINVDNDPPTGGCDPLPTYFTDGLVTISWSGTDVGPAGVLHATLYARVPGGAMASQYTVTGDSGVFTYSGFSTEGTYEFNVRFVDNVLNAEATPSTAECSTFYDAAPPAGSIAIDGGATSTVFPLVDLSLSYSDTGSGVTTMELSNDSGATWVTQSLSDTVSNWNLTDHGGNIDPGAKTVQVRYTDAAGRMAVFSDDISYAPPSPNDSYASPETISDGPITGTLVGATNDGENGLGNAGQPDVWFSYRVPGPGVLRVDTCGSNALSGVDTTLSLHPSGEPGTAANALVANDDNEAAECAESLDSALQLETTAVETILIRVSQYDPPPGAFQLNVEFIPAPVLNDSFATPQAIEDGQTFGTLLGATNDGESDVGTPSQPDVWYSYTVPGPGYLYVLTCGSNLLSGVDTTLSLHPFGEPGTAANVIDSNDDNLRNECTRPLDSALQYGFATGQTILIRVSQYGPPAGAFNLTTFFTFADDSDGDGLADTADNCLFIVNPDQADSNGDNIGNLCDGDLTGPGGVEDCLVNFLDLQLVKDAFFATPVDSDWDPRADIDQSGQVNFTDLQIVKGGFFGPPGPSAMGCD